jgi:hypothetical protein
LVLGYARGFSAIVGWLHIQYDLYQQQSPDVIQGIQNKKPELLQPMASGIRHTGKFDLLVVCN